MARYLSATPHSIDRCLNDRGWQLTKDIKDAALILSTPQQTGQIYLSRADQWVWAPACAPLANKARMFEMLETAFAEGKAGRTRRWPETCVLRNLKDIATWRSSITAHDTKNETTRYFVKHPRTSGGAGTFPANCAEAACALAVMVLKTSHDAVVIQRAINPAKLPRGPSFFELRVWALLRQRECWLFQNHRAKTATSGLMNRKVQTSMDTFGRFYADNIASEGDIRAAFEGDSYDTQTKPDIAAAVTLIHRIFQSQLAAGVFTFVGFDFIVDECARPWLIEANVKPAFRYSNLLLQFPSPVVRELASYAMEDLARVFDGDRSHVNSSMTWARLDNKLATL
mmetsp:Transcript_1735/g.5108  ORF Transcript_1735/g.5108 Transcript_1735/m.5108 type:complete len:341 (-) Transcript_1735:350-1372(-)